MPKKVHVVRKKSRRHHFWIFSNEVKKVEGNPQTGEVVFVYEHNHFIGSGLYNKNSLIRVRLYSEQKEPLSVIFFENRIRKAWAYRKTILPNENDFRLVYGESDGLPGVVIDKYANTFVLQTYSAGMDMRQGLIVEALKNIFNPTAIFEKNDFRLRDAENLPRRENLLYGDILAPVIISENGVKYIVNIQAGQKTGFFYDQRITRQKVQVMSKGKSVLDVFCYTGGFSLNAAKGGAKEVLGIDASEAALELARENAKLNKVHNVCKFINGDAFIVLRELNREKRKFDIIVLDPPPFFKKLSEKPQGIKGYKDINLQAMKLLAEGGMLVSCTCSHYLFWQDLLDVLSQASQDTGKTFKIVDRTTQGPDHPVLLNMPESEYLRCFFLEVY